MRQNITVCFQSKGGTEWIKHGKELKARIALDAIKGQKTISELASKYGIHANQISRWKRQLLDAAPEDFSQEKDRLSGMSVGEKIKNIDTKDTDLLVSRQYDSLRLPCSSYYRPRHFPYESMANLGLMRLIDEEFPGILFTGSKAEGLFEPPGVSCKSQTSSTTNAFNGY